MSTIGQATLQSDENGLVTMQCDRCETRFKLECEYLNEELDGDICCPVCGISNTLDTYWPKEVVEEAKKVAIMEEEQAISNMFKGFNSKYIKVKTTPVKKVDRNIVFKNKDYDLKEIIVHCCNKKVALMASDITSGFYCPYCGRIVK